MAYDSHVPGPPLDAFVENLWSLSDAPAHTREQILPSGTLELVINLQEDEFRIYDAAEGGPPQRFRGAMVSGAYSRPFVIDTQEHASIIGVHFAPGGALPFLGAPPGGCGGRSPITARSERRWITSRGQACRSLPSPSALG